MKQFNTLSTVVVILIILALCVQFACAPPPPVVKPQNNAPVIENIIYTKDAFSNTEVQIECLASDIDGDNLTYQWKAGAGNITGEGKNVLWMPPGKVGTYPITLVVSDGKSGVATENVSIRVVTNADGTATPTIEVNLKLGEAQPVVIDKQRARIWTTTDIVCTVENADGNELTYTWSANGGKIQGKGAPEGKANRIGWIAPGVQSDITVNVSVTDIQQGREAKGQVNIHVFCCGS